VAGPRTRVGGPDAEAVSSAPRSALSLPGRLRTWGTLTLLESALANPQGRACRLPPSLPPSPPPHKDSRSAAI
jgi:hypothetical protein